MVVRWAYLAFGITCVGLGFIGVVVPGMPTTIFMILALWGFKRSSPRLESWLLNHRIFGPTLRDWEQNKTVKPRTKAIAITMLWVMIGISCWVTHKPVVRIILACVAISVTIYLLTRRSYPEPSGVAATDCG